MSNFYQILSSSGTVGKLHTKGNDPIPLPSTKRMHSLPLDDCSTTDGSSSVSIYVDSTSSTSEYAKQPIIYVPTTSKRDLLSDCGDDTFDKIWGSNMNASTTSSMSDTCDSLLLSMNKLHNGVNEPMDLTLPAESREQKYRRYRALQSREHPLKRGRNVVRDAKQDSADKPSKGRSHDPDLFGDTEMKLPARNTASLSPERKPPSNFLSVDDRNVRRAPTGPLTARSSRLNAKANAKSQGLPRNQKTDGKTAPFNAPMTEALQIAFPDAHDHPLPPPPKKPSGASFFRAASAPMDSNMSTADRIRELRNRVEHNLKQMVETEQLGIENLKNQVKLFRESSRGQPIEYEENLRGGEDLKDLKAKKILPMSDLYYYPKVINE